MQGRRLTEDERRSMREALVDAACALIEAEGVEAVTLRRLGGEIGVSRTTPYTYFADKDALIEAVRLRGLERLVAACERAQDEPDVAARLRAVGRSYVDFALSQPALYGLLFGTPSPSPEHAEAVARYRDLAVRPLREAAGQGILAFAPEQVATALWAATHGLLELHRAGKIEGFEGQLATLGDVLAFGFVRREGT